MKISYTYDFYKQGGFNEIDLIQRRCQIYVEKFGFKQKIIFTKKLIIMFVEHVHEQIVCVTTILTRMIRIRINSPLQQQQHYNSKEQH